MIDNPPAYIDLAQIVLYLFWIFFAGVVYYLLRENKREGYPLDTGRRGNRVNVQGFPAMPEPKTYLLRDGGTFTAPNAARDTRPVNGTQVAGEWGSPVVPNGNPLLSGVGPGAYAQRADVPDRTAGGAPKIVPLRVATEHHLDSRDPDPRGMPVIAYDRAVAGVVRDAWVDRSETLIRYLEVELSGTGGTTGLGGGIGRRVLVPMTFVRVKNGAVRVRALLAHQFADVPALRNPEQITLLEEERVCAYFGAGTLYAHPGRLGPVL